MRPFTLIAIAAVILSACGPVATSRPAATPTSRPTPTAILTPTSQTVLTEELSDGRVRFVGSGHANIEIEKTFTLSALEIKAAQPGGEILIKNFSTISDRQLGIVLDTQTPYSGVVPLDFVERQQTARLEVQTSGSWEITHIPESRLQVMNVPELIEGNGDGVFLVRGAAIESIRASKNSKITSLTLYDIQRESFSVSIKAGGEASIPRKLNAYAMVIRVTGAWSLEFFSVSPTPTRQPTKTPTQSPPTATRPAPTAVPVQSTNTPAPQPTDTPTQPPAENCDRQSYPDVCIPPFPPDLNCGDIPFRRFRVLPPDPHNFDNDNDGIGCES